MEISLNRSLEARMPGWLQRLVAIVRHANAPLPDPVAGAGAAGNPACGAGDRPSASGFASPACGAAEAPADYMWAQPPAERP